MQTSIRERGSSLISVRLSHKGQPVDTWLNPRESALRWNIMSFPTINVNLRVTTVDQNFFPPFKIPKLFLLCLILRWVLFEFKE